MSLVRRSATLAVIGALACASSLVAQRWYRRWGATDEEAREALPGDGAVRDPMLAHTHAVTIDAARGDVWPWLAQLGTGRGGWYSYDWIENAAGLGVRSADRVVPELQDLHEGDVVPLSPDLGLDVKEIDRPRLLRLEGHGANTGDATWAFVLREVDDGSTRLIARLRARWPVRGVSRALLGALEPGMFAMERKMLLEVKRRAERLARERVPALARAAAAV